MRVREAIERVRKTDRVVRAPPKSAFGGGSGGERPLDLGVGIGFSLAIVVAEAREQPCVLGQSLLDGDAQSELGLISSHVSDRWNSTSLHGGRKRIAKAAHPGVVVKSIQPYFARFAEDGVVVLDFRDVPIVGDDVVVER